MHKTLANIRQRAEKGAMLVTAALGVTALMFGTAIGLGQFLCTQFRIAKRRRFGGIGRCLSLS